MWDLLHSCAFILDGARQNINGLVEPLTLLLPCKYCRESFVQFYATLGPPNNGGPLEANPGAKWVYEVHKLVNEKLAKQRAETFVKTHKLTGPPATILVANATSLVPQPSFEVVHKRYLVNSDEPIQWRSLGVSLLAIVKGLETSGKTEDMYYAKLSTFLQTIRIAIEKSKQSNKKAMEAAVVQLIRLVENRVEFSRIRTVLQNMKFSQIAGPDQATELCNLIQAGTCIKGTCA
jgi:hypothetical protein